MTITLFCNMRWSNSSTSIIAETIQELFHRVEEGRTVARNHYTMQSTCTENLYLILGNRVNRKNTKTIGKLRQVVKNHFTSVSVKDWRMSPHGITGPIKIGLKAFPAIQLHRAMVPCNSTAFFYSAKKFLNCLCKWHVINDKFSPESNFVPWQRCCACCW